MLSSLQYIAVHHVNPAPRCTPPDQEARQAAFMLSIIASLAASIDCGSEHTSVHPLPASRCIRGGSSVPLLQRAPSCSPALHACSPEAPHPASPPPPSSFLAGLHLACIPRALAPGVSTHAPQRATSWQLISLQPTLSWTSGAAQSSTRPPLSLLFSSAPLPSPPFQLHCLKLPALPFRRTPLPCRCPVLPSHN